LQYGTDEDASDSDPDPSVNRFDLGKDPCEFARWRLELVNELLPGLVDQVTEKGEGYQDVRRAFGVLMSEHSRAMHFVARYIGGVYVNRSHKGDPGAQPPLVITDAKKQREAFDLLEKEVFGLAAYQFPPKLYSFLAASHWGHWGMGRDTNPDLPVQKLVLAMQDAVLNQILSAQTLTRLIDSEQKTPAQEDIFTAADMMERLTAAIFSETDKLQEGKFTNRAPAISGFRRNLQRHYFQQLASLADGNVTIYQQMGLARVPVKIPVPADCQAVAYVELQSLEGRLKKVLAGKAELDTYSRAHLSELAARIQKVLDAQFTFENP
jgi:hypothetical protein